MSKLIKIDTFIIKYPFVTTLLYFLYIFCLLLILQHSIGIIKVIALVNQTISIQNYTKSTQGTNFDVKIVLLRLLLM